MGRLLLATILGALVLGIPASTLATGGPSLAHGDPSSASARLQPPLSGAPRGTEPWLTPPNQPALDAAAGDAQAIAGVAYFTEAAIDTERNIVDVYLCDAPQAILDKLEGLRPGTYIFHNSAAHPRRALLALEESIAGKGSDWTRSGVAISYLGPTRDGYLEIGVTSELSAAVSKLNAIYGADWIRVVHVDEPASPAASS